VALILAVEPDARQAANLSKVLSLRPRTELVIAESAVLALQTLADRVPDVLLTSPLLSRQDEAALAGWLRELGPAAAHVQELTIPILAAAPAPKKKRGVLATLRRKQRQAKPDGCEPDAFAEHISVYAERATAGRKYEPPPPVDLLLLPPTEAELAVRATAPVAEVAFRDELTLSLHFDAEPAPPAPVEDDRVALILLPPTLRELAAMNAECVAEPVVFRDELTLPLRFDAPIAVVEEAFRPPMVEEAFRPPA